MKHKKYQKDLDLLSGKIINEINNLAGRFYIKFINPIQIHENDDRDMIIGIEDGTLITDFEGEEYYVDIDSSISINLLLDILYEIENILSSK